MAGLGRPKMMAVGVIAAAILLPGAYRVYLISRPPEADLVISGRTPVDEVVVGSGGMGGMGGMGGTRVPGPATVSAPPSAEVVVHVAGAVKKPGVYHLAVTARAEDALKAAGGATADAYLDAINLAAHVDDGQQMYVPNKKEQSAGGAPQPAAAVGSGKRAMKPGGKAGTSSRGNKLTSPGQGTVNLNTASAEELQRLPGVGPAMAARILDYRKTNGGFQQVEQLMDVSGIGAKKFEKMKGFVRVR